MGGALGVAEGDRGIRGGIGHLGEKKGPWVEGASPQGKEGGFQSRERT